MRTISGAIVVVLFVAVVGFARTPASGGDHQGSPHPQQAAPRGDVARGEYLANSVAMCVQCHSPRDAQGNILADQKFTGATMPVRGPAWDRDWAYRAPAIAGLPGFTDAQIVMLLTEGHAGDRQPPMHPMPPFRMVREDAEAVVAYLRTR